MFQFCIQYNTMHTYSSIAGVNVLLGHELYHRVALQVICKWLLRQRADDTPPIFLRDSRVSIVGIQAKIVIGSVVRPLDLPELSSNMAES